MQSLTQKVVNTFIKGLITEAGELTFPENASIDELNCDLRRDGSRRRRLGAELEDSFVLSSFTMSDSSTVVTDKWENVGGQSGLEFLVIQVGASLKFYAKATLPYSSSEDSATINLTTYEVAGGVGAANAQCQFTSINGALIVVSPAINTIYIQRDNTTGILTVNQITLYTRDFDWLGDKRSYTTSSATASIQRQYDTFNGGWSTTLKTTYGSWPPLTHPWYSGKDSSGNFSASEFNKIYSGTSLLGNGRFILNFFSKDRSTASGVVGLPTEIETSRFKSVASYAGRVFYAGLESARNSGVILFSRTIETLSELGDCYQQNDPTSEEISDLLDTDGGVIRIPNAVNIKKLYSRGPDLFVFAENGVWKISGVDNIFRATDYSISFISSIGIQSASSFIEAEGLPFWWSLTGIHTLSVDQSAGIEQEQNLSITTIQSFLDKISSSAKTKVTGIYDKVNKKLYWAYPNNNETKTTKYSNLIVLDITLQAFYPWKVSNGYDIVGFVYYSGFGSEALALDVVQGLDDVYQGTDDIISTQLSDFTTGDPAIVLVTRDLSTNKLTMAGFTNSSFYDWTDVDYSSYAIAGHEFFGDLMLDKTSPYIEVYMRSTETGWVGSEAIGYDLVRPSGILVSPYWDFSKTPSTAPQQGYRLSRMPVVDSSDLTSVDIPETVVHTRLKLRGKGKTVRFRFDSEAGKDFVLLGYGLIGGKNGRI
jgi:hypothetical protein